MAKSSHTATVGLAEVEGALERIKAETTVSGLLRVLCTELVELLDAQRAVVSRVIGDLIVELSDHDSSGGERALELFLLSDYPLTRDVLETGKPQIVLREDPAAEPSETALLEQRGFDSLLLAPLRPLGRSWGLVEIYGDARGFEQEEIRAAFALVEGAGELLPGLEGAA